MDIREFLSEVGTTYDRQLGTKSGVYAQDLLRAAREHIGPYVPVGWEVGGNGGNGYAGFTPWVGVYSPSVTLNPHRGLYVVYLFAADLKSVTLALNQGVTELKEELKSVRAAKAVLKSEAERLVAALPALQEERWRQPMDLACNQSDQKAYEAGAVATRRYDLADLPTEKELRTDLWRMADFLQSAAVNQAEHLSRRASPKDRRDIDAARLIAAAGDPAEWFKPKDASDYEVHLASRTMTKRREHEELIKQFGLHVQTLGFSANTNVHPRDLTLKKAGTEWLVEAKAIYSGNATQAVREAIGQLFTYRHFLYLVKQSPSPHLLALFTEPIGPGYVEFLESIDIGSVWRTPAGWEASHMAEAWGVI